MVDLATLRAEDLSGLDPGVVAELAVRMLAELKLRGEQAERDAQTIRLKDARLEKITFELARLKAWKFGARTERMNAEQRQMFETTVAEDEADLAAQLAALQGEGKVGGDAVTGRPDPKAQPRRKPLPDHLRRVDHRHEPVDTTCGCGQAMVRVGEDVSERLDVIPAEFFVHRHIRGKWTCRCCAGQGDARLVQEPVDPQIVDKGLPTAGLVAHTMIGHFVDHLPYYRLEQINARSGVVTPRSTLASWSGAGGAALTPLFDAHRTFILGARVLHADETPVRLLDPGAGKTRKAYVWAYARGAFDPVPGVVYDFCISRAARHPVAFLGKWSGTLVCDDYGAYDVVFKLEDRIEAGCLAHARRRFEELLKAGASASAAPALQRIAELYRVEREIAALTSDKRRAVRHARSRPLWGALHAWMIVERRKVPDGGGAAAALDYSLNRWKALGRFLEDGAVAIDNNHCENLIRPSAMGRKAWLFAGSELAGQRAAMVMSLVHSAKLHGHDPWAYLKDVLERLPMHPNHHIDELLPHRWTPNG